MPRPRATRDAAAAPTTGIDAAFDVLRFGADSILNLRAAMPTGAEASHRANAWLRERQATKGGGSDVLVITGRGRGSLDGVPVVRDAFVRLLPQLRRAGVIVGAREHTPGSFVVRLAPLQALVDAPGHRSRAAAATPRVVTMPVGLAALSAASRDALERLALAALAAIGIQRPSPDFIADEMLRQFATLAPLVVDAVDRDAALRALLERAVEEY